MKFFDSFSGYGGFHLGIERAYDLGNKSTDETGEQTESNEDMLQVQQRKTIPTLLRNDSRIRATNKVGRSILPTDNREQRPVCVGYSEIDKYASAVYKYHFGGRDEVRSIKNKEQKSKGVGSEKRQCSELDNKCTDGFPRNFGDIKTINPTELEDFDLFCGGFPCQAFSIAGNRLGFADTRGTLIYEVFRILKEKQPRFVLLENVKGLLSHDSGRTFKTIISSLAELGYSVEWQVLNAKNFGVPQNRERVFIIGHLGAERRFKIFPIKKGNEKSIEPDAQRNDIAHTVTNSDKHRGSYIKSDIPQRVSDKRSSIRRLTPTECERLMGLPDGWTSKGDFNGEIKEISDTQRYKLCGNGVVVNVVEEIIRRLL